MVQGWGGRPRTVEEKKLASADEGAPTTPLSPGVLHHKSLLNVPTRVSVAAFGFVERNTTLLVSVSIEIPVLPDVVCVVVDS